MHNKAHLTLWDISHRLGMSRTTVSLAMRDDPRISEATKNRVLAAVKKLNYQPNQLARTLATGKSNLVGVVVPNTSDRVYAEIFRGIEDAAQADSYHVLLSNASYELEQEASRIRDMMSLRIAGIIAAPVFTLQKHPPRIWQELRRFGFPIVILNRELNPPIFHQVSVDNAAGIRMACETLASLGHRRVAYITGFLKVIPIEQRLEAFRHCAAQNGLDTDPALIEGSELSLHGGYESCGRLWHRLRKKPTAILVFSDTPAVGTMRYLHEQRVKVPNQVSVVGFDGTDTSEYLPISLTTVGTPMYEMGRQAFALLKEVMAHPRKAPRSILLPVHLIRRESVAECRSG
jgi:DNA-binding LacI/PurR family transcriptional regulator